MTRPLAALALLLALLGCSAPAGTTIADPPLEGEQTWYGVIGPLVATRCGICHRDGDIAPFALDTYEQVKAMASAVSAAVTARRMPPFPPEQTDESGCPRIDDVRRMSEQERTVLLDWLANGAPEGTPRTLPAVPKNEPLGPPDETWQVSEPYTGTGTDDYRCFVVAPTLLTSIPVAALSVKPGNRKVVHHSAVYLVGPNELAAVRKLDADDPKAGYGCFGGVGVANAAPAGLWVPGNDAPVVPPHMGVGYYLAPGWGFVVQQHYNYSAGLESDQSAVVLWRANAFVTETPHTLTVGNMSFSIPPRAMGFAAEGSGDFTAARTASTLTSTAEGRIYTVWGHQHLLGRSFEMTLLRSDGSEQCLLRIPRWQYGWQSIYRLKSFVDAKVGDRLRVRCEWDNPSDHSVSYGEGTADEMCFGAVAMLDPGT